MEGGNAERTGQISAGDVLISTSGYVYTKASEYQGNMVRSGETLVTMNVKGEVWPFDAPNLRTLSWLG